MCLHSSCQTSQIRETRFKTSLRTGRALNLWTVLYLGGLHYLAVRECIQKFPD